MGSHIPAQIKKKKKKDSRHTDDTCCCSKEKPSSNVCVAHLQQVAMESLHGDLFSWSKRTLRGHPESPHQNIQGGPFPRQYSQLLPTGVNGLSVRPANYLPMAALFYK